MHLFSRKKKTDDMKPLTEEDIQRKLYGSYKKDTSQSTEKDAGMTSPLAGESEQDVALTQAEEDKDLFALSEDEEELSEDEAAGEDDTLDEEEPSEESESELDAQSADETKVRMAEPEGYRVIADSESVEQDTTPLTPHELEEHIFEESKSAETVKFTYDKSDETPARIPGLPRSQVNWERLQEIMSSFKIDASELLDKIKSIPPSMIVIVVASFVVLVVIFNMWTRASREQSYSFISAPRATEEVHQEPGAVDGTVSLISPTSEISEVRPSRGTAVESSVMGADVSIPGEATPFASSFYTIQVCVYENVRRAQSLADSFKAKQQDSFYNKVETRSGRELYTVYIGRYSSIEEANKAFAAFKQTDEFKDFPDSFIKWLR